MSDGRERPVTRRTAVAAIALGVAGAPAFVRGRYRLFAQSSTDYSARCIQLMERSLVVDLLNQFRFEDFAEKPPRITSWLSRVGSVSREDMEIYRGSGITALGLPAYSRSVSPGGCDKDGPGEVNVPISCGGTVVSPGDIIVGDSDGVAVVPRADAEEVLDLVAQLMDRERKRIAEIHAGQLFRADVDELLRSKGAIA
jgi:hypothetical protein